MADRRKAHGNGTQHIAQVPGIYATDGDGRQWCCRIISPRMSRFFTGGSVTDIRLARGH